MSNNHKQIIENDLLIAECYEKIASLVRKNSALRGEISDEPLQEIENNKSDVNHKFDAILNEFPIALPNSLDPTNNDDAYVRTIMGKIQIGLTTVVKPNVDTFERGVYLGLDDSITLFRKSSYNSKYKCNTFAISVDKGDFCLFNNSDYCLLARYGQGGEGFKDWAIFDLRGWVIAEKDNKLYLQNNETQVELDPKDKNYIWIRSSDGPQIIHTG